MLTLNPTHGNDSISEPFSSTPDNKQTNKINEEDSTVNAIAQEPLKGKNQAPSKSLIGRITRGFKALTESFSAFILSIFNRIIGKKTGGSKEIDRVRGDQGIILEQAQEKFEGHTHRETILAYVKKLILTEQFSTNPTELIKNKIKKKESKDRALEFFLEFYKLRSAYPAVKMEPHDSIQNLATFTAVVDKQESKQLEPQISQSSGSTIVEEEIPQGNDTDIPDAPPPPPLSDSKSQDPSYSKPLPEKPNHKNAGINDKSIEDQLKKLKRSVPGNADKKPNPSSQPGKPNLQDELKNKLKSRTESKTNVGNSPANSQILSSSSGIKIETQSPPVKK